MQNLHKRNKVTSSKGWIPSVKIEENMRKRAPVPASLRLYHYAGNNPVRYIDPDGNDIAEVTLYSASIAALAAVRLSIGIAIDSRNNVALFLKEEIGVGAGTDFGVDKLLKNFVKETKVLFFDNISKTISYTESGIEIMGNLLTPPEDTGKGNLSGIFTNKIETSKNWKSAPVDAAIFIGAEGDKDGNVSISFGLKAIAAAYLASNTTYVTVFSPDAINDFALEIDAYEEQMILNLFQQIMKSYNY